MFQTAAVDDSFRDVVERVSRAASVPSMAFSISTGRGIVGGSLYSATKHGADTADGSAAPDRHGDAGAAGEVSSNK